MPAVGVAQRKVHLGKASERTGSIPVAGARTQRSLSIFILKFSINILKPPICEDRWFTADLRTCKHEGSTPSSATCCVKFNRIARCSDTVFFVYIIFIRQIREDQPLRAATGQCHQVPLCNRHWRFDSAAAHHIIKYTDMKIILLSLLLTVIAVGGGYAIGEWLVGKITELK